MNGKIKRWKKACQRIKSSRVLYFDAAFAISFNFFAYSQ